MAAAPIAERAGVVMMGVSASPEITHAGDYIFRTNGVAASQAPALSGFMNQQYSKIAVLQEQTDYAIGMGASILGAYTGTVVDTETFLSSESDFRTRLTRIKNTDAEAIFIIVQTAKKFDLIMKQMEEQQLQLPLVMDYISKSAITAEDTYLSYLASLPGVYSADVVPTPQGNALLERYRARYGAEPSMPDQIAIFGDSVDMLYHAIAVAGTTDADAVRDALYALQDYPGLQGVISFDANGDVYTPTVLQRFEGV
ncbi:ABC transporter substrate-binding protein [Candidatus Peribacteria bacterium]|nr:ABC transporter substrate-binding protein [Candidatus Peribacteria bacterium]